MRKLTRAVFVTVILSLVFPAVNVARQNTVAPQKIQQRADNWKDAFLPGTWSGWVLALVGIFGTLAAVGSLKAIRRQAEIMAQQAKVAEDNAKAALVSADAAKENAEAAKKNVEAFIKAERAWIMVKGEMIPNGSVPELEDKKLIDIRPVFRNSGRTPGRIVRGFICSHRICVGSGLPPEPDYQGRMQNDDHGEGVNIVMGPNDTAQFMNVLVSRQDFIQASQGTIELYVYGFVDYVDLASKERQSRFCFRYVPHGVLTVSAGFYSAVNIPTAYTECT